MHTLVVLFFSTKFIQNNQQNLPVSHYLGIKLDMLFEIARSAETVIILGKGAF